MTGIENIGTATAPVFAKGMGLFYGMDYFGFYSAPALGDLDGDGTL